MAANETQDLDKAVTDGGAYDVIKARLNEQANKLKTGTDKLNQDRINEFGQTKLEVNGRIRVRTENNCIARDIVRVGEHLLFAYNVFIGLKKETLISDVFSLYQLVKTEQSYDIEAVSLTDTFLDDSQFKKEFHELYQYYKEAQLIQLRVENQILFAVFQIGRQISDIRVFQWQLDKEGSATYIDNRGERALPKSQSHDFEWTSLNREDHVSGKHPHINILDKVFVETIGGDLTIKVENNTGSGLGIYSEAVDDKTQSLADADIQYAEVGSLILIKIKPYREQKYRYLVFNTNNHQVDRIDNIGSACIALPEDHGIIFPGGYYLQNGETKSFPDNIEGLQFKRLIRSPNGEDVLYVFYEPIEGISGLYSYNMIRKELQNPIYGHGYSLYEDGLSVIFNAEEEATRVHPMQVWQTPYFTQEHAAKTPTGDSFFSRIGNKELVRGISDLISLTRAIFDPKPTRNLYEGIITTSKRLFDSYYWLDSAEAKELGELIKEINQTSELVIDEFEKVEQIRAKASQSLNQAEASQKEILTSIRVSDWQTPEQYVTCLAQIRQQRGHLISLKDQRYIDLERIEALDNELSDKYDELSQATVSFLADDSALKPYWQKIEELEKTIEQATQVVTLAPLTEELETLANGLDLLIDILNALQVDDSSQRTKILDDISEIYSRLNQIKAKGRNRHKELGASEAVAEFAAQFRLFSQSISNALGMADTPDRADDEQSRLLVQLEELESKFSDYDEFLSDILNKREEINEAFESKKQFLIEERQRKANNINSAALRIISGITRRLSSFTTNDEFNSYFAADPMVSKVNSLVTQLRSFDEQIKADDLEAQLKSAKEQGIRGLRDKQDIFEDGGNAIKLGKHKFSVNSQALDLSLLPREGVMQQHLVGTDFYQSINDEKLDTLKAYWDQALVSENKHVSRAEYLSYQILQAAEKQKGLSFKQLEQALIDDTLLDLVKQFSTPLYKEAYEKGIHDHDTSLILKSVIPVYQQAGLLRYSPQCRAIAILFWTQANTATEQQRVWKSYAISAQALSLNFDNKQSFFYIASELEKSIESFCNKTLLSTIFSSQDINQAAEYLVHELAKSKVNFASSQNANNLINDLNEHLKQSGHDKSFQQAMSDLDQLEQGSETRQILLDKWSISYAWLDAFCISNKHESTHYLAEAAALLLCKGGFRTETSSTSLQVSVNNLLSEHNRIEQGKLSFSLDEFCQRLAHFCANDVTNYTAYHDLRQQISLDLKQNLRLEEFTARPLTSFVRNRLINEVYLPIIGDNLAKQMGTLGSNKRTDLMGLLLLISPPGYGKTTLMEYVASRLGLVFMKINCPSLGHEVSSLDPSNAPNATALQELEKINLALEMGSNVMLYLDDIQHTHPEFLQKFIALCDGTRRIEGVWQGQSKTYDMRGKKFCVVMSGNPYTESGDVFKVPDMLANRADIYNLGDVLGGQEEVFSLSYIENSLTSNSVLNQLALREMADVYKFVDLAKGSDMTNTDFSYDYSTAEINEISAVLKHLLVIQEVVLKVNLAYIKSAATAENYRTEPPFKLQGSYRNMNKMAEKVSAVMNHDELMQMIADHYVGEAQTLTSGAEENLLKLAQLRGNMTEQQQQRWQEICQKFKQVNGSEQDEDPAIQLVSKVSNVATSLQQIQQHLDSNSSDIPTEIRRLAMVMVRAWSKKDKQEKKTQIDKP